MSSALFKNKPYSYSHTPDIPSSPTGSSSAIPLTPRQDQQSFSAVPLSPGLPRHPIAPDAQAYLPPRPSIRQRPSLKGKERASFLDEILPTPTSAGSMRDSGRGVLRRTGAVAVILVFVLVASWLAATESGGKAVSEGTRELRHVFGQGMAEWAVQEALHDSHASDATAEASTSEAEVDAEKHGGQQIDFDQFVMLRTIPASMVELSGHGRRVIFLGDVHGSIAPLKKLMAHLSYSPSSDTLVHVGDLVAKGEHSIDVLRWFEERNILGVRGNHDQPVIQWRAWMEWAGGDAWEGLVSELSEEKNAEVVAERVGKMGKSWPKGLEWKGDHWHIAKKLSKREYAYLVQLPLILHIPSMHTHVVHAGLLPSNPLRDPDHPTQPLVAAARQAESHVALESGAAETDEAVELGRNSEEISILLDIPQNSEPYNLINMRGLYEKGKKKGRPTKSGKKGTPWSDVWKREMGRCTGVGAGLVDDAYWSETESRVGSGDQEEERDGLVSREYEGHGEEEQFDEIAAEEESEGADVQRLKKLRCSPVTVIYGHAAARGLDIKPYSKGIDTGCVYGHELTALVLGETAGLEGKKVRVGEHKGLLVSVPCQKGGL